MVIDIIGARINLGCNRTGVENGYVYLKEHLHFAEVLSAHTVTDCGAVSAPSWDEVQNTNPVMKNLPQILDFNERLANRVYESCRQGHFPLIIGGDHVLAWGSISGVARHYPDLGCAYIDAHGDFNPAEESPSHNVHGMHMCYILGLQESDFNNWYRPGIKIRKEDIVFAGTRSLDRAERELAASLKLDIHTSQEIRRRGVEAVTAELLDKVNASGRKCWHLSFDIDVLDPQICPGTGVPEKDGISLEDGAYMLEKLLATGRFVSMDLVEFNPLLDHNDITFRVCQRLLQGVNKSL